MPLNLTAVQRRVLGVLIEKSMSTPGGAPLTLNALLAGCNQLTCREPVMQLAGSEVSQALAELKRMKLVREPDYEPGSRVDRFRHNVEQQLGWDPRQQAIIAELLLRGPQTVGELKTNASRLTPLPDLPSVSQVLAGFSGQNPPMVRELPRQPGKSVPRFDHLFYPDNEAHAAPPVDGPSLEARVARLEQELAALQEQVRALQTRPQS